MLTINKLYNTNNVLIELPTSKSISNRALIIQALCHQPFTIQHLSTAQDTVALQQMLQANTMIVNANEAGTALRFGTAFFACTLPANQVKVITAAPSLRKRPIAPLVDALTSMGANIQYADAHGFAPLKITGVQNLSNKVTVAADVSSQFVTALCLLAPSVPTGLQITLHKSLTSAPYVHMTLQMMQQFGVTSLYENNVISILPQAYQATNYTIEPDWSAASFFYAAAMLLPNPQITLSNLTTQSLQGDAILYQMQAITGVETTITENGLQLSKDVNNNNFSNTIINAADFPDMAIPLIVACAVAKPHLQFSGLHTLLVKESNRILALQTELAKVGILLVYENNLLRFQGQLNPRATPVFDTYQDHRIAMALSLLAFVLPNVTINNPEVVAKSFPNYWQQLLKFASQK